MINNILIYVIELKWGGLNTCRAHFFIHLKNTIFDNLKSILKRINSMLKKHIQMSSKNKTKYNNKNSKSIFLSVPLFKIMDHFPS